MRRRTLILIVLAVALGVAGGGAGMLYLLSQKPGERLVNRVLVGLGMREDLRDRYAFGLKSAFAAGDWRGVTSPTHPKWKVRPGYDVIRVASGLTYPVNLAFVPNPGPEPDAPIFYVNELHGTVKYMTRSGEWKTYQDGLINFDPIPQAKSDESGLSGLMLVPGSEDLIVTAAYLDDERGLFSNRILRLVSEPGGRRAKRVDTLLDLKQFTAPSNQVQQASIGSDGKLYISVGDAENARLSLDLNHFGGKILRCELDGSACADNPFFDPDDPTGPRSYVWVYGVRNVFDLDVDPVGGQFFAVDNGKATDRLVRLAAGAGYGWDGSEESMLTNALFSWKPSVSPCGITFLRQPVLGENTANRMYVACYGPPTIVGRNHSKMILEFELGSKQRLLSGVPAPLIQNIGNDRMTVLGLAEGPDGLYFTDFFGSTDGSKPEGVGSVWKVVPSEATKGLAADDSAALSAQTPLEQGRVFFGHLCAVCHRLEGVGGSEGPDLTHFRRTGRKRLEARGYIVEAEELLKSEQTFLVEQRPRLREVLAAKGDERVRVWLRHHLKEPRFDNPRARMPGFGHMDEETRQAIVTYLLDR